MSSAGVEQHGLGSQAYTTASLAKQLGLEWQAGQHHSRSDRIVSAAPLSSAQCGQISFLANPAYRDQLRSTQASAVILADSMAEHCPADAIISTNPYASWAQALALLHPPHQLEAGIAASADVDPTASIHPSARIEALCHIGADVQIGPSVRIGPGSIIERGAVIGQGCQLVGKVYLGEQVRLGQRVIVHPGAVIGADGFGMAMDAGQWRKVAQLGSVQIGDDCEIGANTTIDRGALDDTILGTDVRLDNQVQIAHNVVIGDHTAIAGCVGIAGSTRIGKYCMIAGASGIGGHLEICDHVIITAMTTVLDSIDKPGAYGSGIPARPMRSWQRILVRLGQLDRFMRIKK